MASKVKVEKNNIILKHAETRESSITGYCKECLLDWCSLKGEVSFCTMKIKGFFECPSCMLKLIRK